MKRHHDPIITLSFNDTWNGSTYARGRWELWEHDLEHPHRSACLGTVRDDEVRRLDGRVYVSERVIKAAEVLSMARSIAARDDEIDLEIVAVANIERDDVPGWTCLLTRLPEGDVRRGRPDLDLYAEVPDPSSDPLFVALRAENAGEQR